MRLKASIISFILALAAGIGLGLEPPIVVRLWPSFSKEEAASKVGRRVRYSGTEKFRGMKCSEEGRCRSIGTGEYGTIIRIEEVPDGGYFLVVRWGEPGTPDSFLSYFGRYTHGESLIEE